MNKNNSGYITGFLGQQDIDDMLALQAAVSSALGENQKHFFIPKTQDALEAHFSKNGKALGIWSGTKLIAQSIIFSDTLKTDWTKSTRLGCVLVHPDFRKSGLSGSMIETWLDLAEKEHFTQAEAIVKTKNFKSLNSFLKQDFKISCQGQSPEDGNDVFFLHKKLGSHNDNGASLPPIATQKHREYAVA